MLITSLSVEGIGRFVGTARVDGFGKGVNVLAAGNEVGKSTLFKATRTCLFSRHSCKDQLIKDLASEGSQLPATVQLGFAQNGHAYLIRKSFLRSPSAILSQDGREIARGKEADEAVWDILGLRPGKRTLDDDGAFGLLWVGQGASFVAPIPGAGASNLLNAAIESEVGTLVGGERARQLLEEITRDLQRYLTPAEQQARSDGPLARARAEVERWRTTEGQLETKLAALEAQFADLAERRRRHAALTDPIATEELTQQLAGARSDLIEARAADQELRRHVAEESAAKRALEAAALRLAQHCDLTARIDANRKTESTCAKDAPELVAREQEARTTAARTDEQIAGLEKASQGLLRREQQIEKIAAATVRAQRKDELASQIKTVEDAAKALRKTDAQLVQINIKPKIVEDLDWFDREIASHDAQLSAAAARLDVEIKPEALGRVRIGRQRANASFSAPVLAPVTIALANLAVITVTPAVHPKKEKRQELDQARSDLLKSAGVASVAEAHAILSKRRDLEAERKAVLTQLKALNVEGDPEPAIGKLKASVAEIEAAIEAALADSGRQGLPSAKELEEERLAAARERTAIEARRDNLEAARTQQQKALEAAVGARSAAKSKIELLGKALSADLALCPDAERAARHAALVADVATAEGVHQTALATLEALRLTAPDPAEIERRQIRCERLEQALENRNAALRQLEREIGQLCGQIQTAGGDGIGEALAAAQQQCRLAERKCARIEERVAVLRLLRNTVAKCLKEGREHYYAPLRRHLRPFLNDLFPGADFELGDGFAISGIKRQRTEPLAHLSDGTQEQIAVLVRLAMGTLLAERGISVPIILDDALVYSDDDRINLMLDALSRAGKYQQIIVLTCHSRAFAPLGGHGLRLQMDGESQ